MSKIAWEDMGWCWAGFSGDTWIAQVDAQCRNGQFKWNICALTFSRHEFAKAGKRKTITEAKRAAQKSWNRWLDECGLQARVDP